MENVSAAPGDVVGELREAGMDVVIVRTGVDDDSDDAAATEE